MSDDEVTLDDLPQPVREGTVPTEELHVDGDNPNEQNEETFGLLCDRMRDRGWLGGPIIADADGCIADGEHRWRAAQEIGLAEVPAKCYDFGDAERRMVRQELNKIAGEHDAKRDALEYDHLLQSGHSEEVEALTDAADEDLDELLAELRVESGQSPAYEYDPEHNVYFEDCVEGMRERLDDDSVDCVITDPPYGVDYQSNWTDSEDQFDKIDADTPEEAFSLYDEIMSEVARVLKPNGHIYTFTRWDVFNDFATRTEKDGITVTNCLIWYNKRGGLGDLHGDYAGEHEFIIFAGRDDARDLQSPKRPRNVLEYTGGSPGDYEHPTQKPVPLIEELITNSTREGDIILDPFMGSGTTAVAAIQNDRDYVGFEVDEDNYRDVIERRIGEAKRQVDAEVNTAESDT